MRFRSSALLPRAARRGFTLMEILVVLAILGLLVGIAVTNLDKIFGGAQVSVAKTFVDQSVRTSLFAYRMHMGDYPSTEEGLQALITAPASKADRWRGPYLDGGKVPLDPWNQPYQYAWPGKHNKDRPDVWSKGPPEKPEEIGNWDSAAPGAEAPK